MKTSTFLAVSLLSLTSTVLAAPTPQLNNILGSITTPSAGDNNGFEGNGNENGNGNGNSNSAGNNNGNGNVAGSGNSAGNGNTVTFPSILKDRDLPDLNNILGSITNPSAGNNNVFKGNGNGNGDKNGNGNSAGNNNGNDNTAGSGNDAGNGNTINFKERDLADDITNTIGSITNPSAGDGNSFLGNGNGNGDGNGNGNAAGNGNGNGNSAGSNNDAGNGNTVNVSPDVSPSIDLPDITLPDITL